MPESEKQIRIFKRGDKWHAELWEDCVLSFEFLDSVTAENYSQLQIEIGNKNWIDLLNK